MWPSIDNQPHSAFEKVHDLLVRMSMLRHFTAGFETRDHLVHRLTTRNGLASNAGANFDPGILFSLFCHGSTMNRSGPLRSIAPVVRQFGLWIIAVTPSSWVYKMTAC